MPRKEGTIAVHVDFVRRVGKCVPYARSFPAIMGPTFNLQPTTYH